MVPRLDHKTLLLQKKWSANGSASTTAQRSTDAPDARRQHQAAGPSRTESRKATPRPMTISEVAVPRTGSWPASSVLGAAHRHSRAGLIGGSAQKERHGRHDHQVWNSGSSSASTARKPARPARRIRATRFVPRRIARLDLPVRDRQDRARATVAAPMAIGSWQRLGSSRLTDSHPVTRSGCVFKVGGQTRSRRTHARSVRSSQDLDLHLRHQSSSRGRRERQSPGSAAARRRIACLAS
ncbi:hypothetical protein A4X06_0g8436 [Tilletia controversa]|uniref:Uncharacterized protein n=1 Tax=Tilletia controversa TaxID=13291 RepID=A0A8X7MKK6_9BASI|nr:hypothetical protein CF336_g8158 [Tilletia laevis]KAE8184478.1 hypothetical protein CF328_g7845 [Tilletia controversa]KAE8239232.1 hypothetical protein A4X06_0g8436 [Tilletia controversa]